MNEQIATGQVQLEQEDWIQPTLPPTDLPYDDGVPLDSDWHRKAMNLLIESLDYHFRDRHDFFVGGNMFLYYSVRQARNRDFRGPDVFFVWGVERARERFYWAIWDEDGKTPDVIIELTSPTTAAEDRTTKKDIYERTLKTAEYFLYDPATKRGEGWRLGVHGQYEPIGVDERGRLWSEQLDLWLGTWTGTSLGLVAVYPRFYDKEGNLVLIGREAESRRADAEQRRADAEQRRADAEQQQKEMERQRADAEQQRADAAQQQKEMERQRADAEQQRADAEQQRADALEVELAGLRARWGEPEAKPPPQP